MIKAPILNVVENNPVCRRYDAVSTVALALHKAINNTKIDVAKPLLAKAASGINCNILAPLDVHV
jgi:hypothetical protein